VLWMYSKTREGVLDSGWRHHVQELHNVGAARQVLQHHHLALDLGNTTAREAERQWGRHSTREGIETGSATPSPRA